MTKKRRKKVPSFIIYYHHLLEKSTSLAPFARVEIILYTFPQ